MAEDGGNSDGDSGTTDDSGDGRFHKAEVSDTPDSDPREGGEDGGVEDE